MKALFVVCAGLMVSQLPVYSQAAAAPDQRLREQVKALTVQLRTAETERATLQVDKQNLETKLNGIEKEKSELAKQSAEEKEAARSEAERLRAEIVAKESEVTQTKDMLVKADTFGKQSAELARKTETERARLSGENIQLKRVVADQRMRNLKMHEIATDVLGRYERFGLGTAITAREPFTGITRARLESLVEDYSGQLAAQRIRVDGTSPKPAPANRPSDQTVETKKTASKP